MSADCGICAGRYRLEGVLGRGPSGVVHAATDMSTGRPCALKRLHGHFHDQATLLALQRDATRAGELMHPSIVAPSASGFDEDGSFYLVMPQVPGESLRARLSRGALSIKETWSVLRAVCSGLAAAHQIGLHHGDLSPGNILCPPHGPAQITDFGMRRLAAAPQSTWVGPSGYLPPEVYRGEVAEATARGDVFSLGAILYECLTGQRLFEGPTEAAVMFRICLGPLPLLPATVQVERERLDALIAMACSKDPEARFDHAGALLHAMELVLGQPAPPLPAAEEARAMPARPVHLVPILTLPPEPPLDDGADRRPRSAGVPAIDAPSPADPTGPVQAGAAPVPPPEESPVAELAAPAVGSGPGEPGPLALEEDLESWIRDQPPPDQPPPQPRYAAIAGWAAGGGAAALVLLLLLRNSPAPSPEPPPSAAAQPATSPSAAEAPPQEPSAATLLLAAEEKLVARDHAGALAAAEEILRRFPHDPAARDLRARAHEALRLQAVLEDFMRAAGRGDIDAAVALYRELPAASHFRQHARETYLRVRAQYEDQHLEIAAAAQQRGACDEVQRQLDQLLLVAEDASAPAVGRARRMLARCRAPRGAEVAEARPQGHAARTVPEDLLVPDFGRGPPARPAHDDLIGTLKDPFRSEKPPGR